MNTMSFSQAQHAYESMTPSSDEDDRIYDIYQDLFNENFFLGQMVQTPDGFGIVVGFEGEYDNFEIFEAWLRLEVAIPFRDRCLYYQGDIKVKRGENWVKF